jgi:hypothetical protein
LLRSNCGKGIVTHPHYSLFAIRYSLPFSDLPICRLPTCPPFLSWLPSSVVANSHSNNQLSFDQSPVAIRHSLPFFSDLPICRLPTCPPFLSWLPSSVVADSHSNNLPVAICQSPVAAV